MKRRDWAGSFEYLLIRICEYLLIFISIEIVGVSKDGHFLK